MKRAIGISVLSGVVLLFAMATGFSLLYRLSYILLLVLPGSYIWGWLNLRWLDVRVERRTLRAQVGEPVVERITVRNTGPLPKSWLEVMDLTDIPGHDTGMSVSLSTRSFRSWRTSTVCRRRGVYTLGPIRVATGDPLGVFRLERRYAGSEQVIVYPAVVPLPHFQIAAADLPGEGPIRRRSHDITPHASSVRDYAPGDNVGRMHWPSSAKLGRLMVKEFDLGLTSDLWVLLDLDRESHVAQGDESTEEVAVTVAASIAARFLKAHLPVGLAASGNALELIPPDSGDLQSARIMDLLSQVHGEGAIPLAQALGGLGRRLHKSTSLVVVTASTSEAWLDAVRILALRNVRTSVVLVDGSSFGGPASPAPLIPGLADVGATAYLVKKGDDLSQTLTTPHVRPWISPAMALGRYSG